jgi:hypothetical protein
MPRLWRRFRSLAETIAAMFCESTFILVKNPHPGRRTNGERGRLFHFNELSSAHPRTGCKEGPHRCNSNHPEVVQKAEATYSTVDLTHQRNVQRNKERQRSHSIAKSSNDLSIFEQVVRSQKYKLSLESTQNLRPLPSSAMTHKLRGNWSSARALIVA